MSALLPATFRIFDTSLGYVLRLAASWGAFKTGLFAAQAWGTLSAFLSFPPLLSDD